MLCNKTKLNKISIILYIFDKIYFLRGLFFHNTTKHGLKCIMSHLIGELDNNWEKYNDLLNLIHIVRPSTMIYTTVSYKMLDIKYTL